MMTKRAAFGASVMAAVALAAAGTEHAGAAQAPSPLRLTGIINDYVESAGAWHVNGSWTAQAKGDSGKADFFASLTMVRSDLWVQLTQADPTNPALRTPHTHHVGLVDGTVTVLSNGWRVSGNAIVTSNGSAGGLSGSPIDVEITGGTLLTSNVKLTFGGASAAHFGTQPLDGVVVFTR